MFGCRTKAASNTYIAAGTVNGEIWEGCNDSLAMVRTNNVVALITFIQIDSLAGRRGHQILETRHNQFVTVILLSSLLLFLARFPVEDSICLSVYFVFFLLQTYSSILGSIPGGSCWFRLVPFHLMFGRCSSLKVVLSHKFYMYT